ncbi:hypothetical protein GCM10023231_39850 [Olivibacter ginsenosidimutans]|uniref:Uncharacterized protein n=1 Tax=Olivibacter ginsenosidimutans TaxID=1176537 RepID=A0ABP9C9U2_9SPHI
MAHTTEPPFIIRAKINGVEQQLTVKTEETTDGVPYFICLQDQEQLTELRKESNGKWVQLWGNLDTLSILAIGKAIDCQPL